MADAFPLDRTLPLSRELDWLPASLKAQRWWCSGVAWAATAGATGALAVVSLGTLAHLAALGRSVDSSRATAPAARACDAVWSGWRMVASTWCTSTPRPRATWSTSRGGWYRPAHWPPFCTRCPRCTGA
ncbi:MAG TPA: hypothetical protein VFH68_17500 [Polyangia bacterium]|nr:hypothetical protein [Polyangia bacterium]